MMKLSRFLIGVIITLMILLSFSACTPDATEMVRIIPTPQSGTTTVAGVLVSYDGVPYTDVIVRLAEVYRKDGAAAFALDAAFSPGGTTNENGEFVIPNIVPGEYVMIIGDPAVNYIIIDDPETGKARVWMAPLDGILDVGVLQIDF